MTPADVEAMDAPTFDAFVRYMKRELQEAARAARKR